MVSLDSTSKEQITEWSLRILSCVSVGFFALQAAGAFMQDPTRISLLFAIISEVTTIVISLASRRPVGRDWQPLTVAATLYAGCLFPFFIDVNSGSRIISESFAATFQIIGLLWTIHAKVSLGRSFGWLPADRGVVETGAYAFVRHPIYLGYLISQVGFLLANLSIQNMLVYVLNLVAQLYRISREEKYLLQNEAYRNYAKRVRFKLIYGVF